MVTMAARAFTLTIFAALIVASPASAATKLSAADKVWIGKCVAERKGNDKPAALRGYCTCMHEVVDDNQPLGITELERSFPPAHQQCWKQHRLKR